MVWERGMRLARTASMLTVIGAIGAAGTLGASIMAGGAAPAAAAAAASLSLSPSVGSPGSAFVVTFSGFYGEVCPSIWIYWDGVEIASGQALQKTLVAHVPLGARVGRHYVKGISGCYESGLIPFDVVPPTTSAPPVPTTTATVPLPLPTLPTTTARPPTAPPTGPAGGSTGGPPSQAPPSGSATVAPSETTTSGGAPAATTSAQDAVHRLVFDKPSVQAGESLSATGTGCEALSTVALTAAGERVGSAVADAGGGFTTPVEFSRVVPGRHVVTASCGTVLTGAVDVVLTSSAGGTSGTLVVLLFFLLAAVTLIARTRGGATR